MHSRMFQDFPNPRFYPATDSTFEKCKFGINKRKSADRYIRFLHYKYVMYSILGDFNVQILMGTKQRMIDIGKIIRYY